MKNIKSLLIKTLFVLATCLVIIQSCKKEEEFPRTRLFSPVLSENLYAEYNTIIVHLGNMIDAVSYTVLVSMDTFNTVLYTIETDTNFIIINKDLVGEELYWFTNYQIAAIAHADDSIYDSNPSFLGNVRTEKFPSNMTPFTENNILDRVVRVFWTPAGEPITGVKVFTQDDLRHENPLIEYDVTQEDRDSTFKIVGGLAPSTTYQVAIYSGETIRGWEVCTTKEAFVEGDNIIDISGIDSLTILADTLSKIPDGSIVLLERGRTYASSGHFFDKSVTIMAANSFASSLPIIDCGSNFDIANGADLEYVIFKDLIFKADFSSDYIFNLTQTGSFGELRLENCKISHLRGIVRMKDNATGTIGQYSIINCVVDSIQGYGVLTVDNSTYTVDDILIENSTFSKCQSFLVSRTNSNSITISNCTMCEVPEQGRQILRWRGGTGNNDVFNGATIENTIWGRGWDMTAAGTFAVKGYEGFDNSTITVLNVYATSDFSFSSGDIGGFPSTQYSGTIDQLWVDPIDGIDFNFLDNGFSGKSDSGDPRWRP